MHVYIHMWYLSIRHSTYVSIYTRNPIPGPYRATIAWPETQNTRGLKRMFSTMAMSDSSGISSLYAVLPPFGAF